MAKFCIPKIRNVWKYKQIRLKIVLIYLATLVLLFFPSLVPLTPSSYAVPLPSCFNRIISPSGVGNNCSLNWFLFIFCQKWLKMEHPSTVETHKSLRYKSLRTFKWLRFFGDFWGFSKKKIMLFKQKSFLIVTVFWTFFCNDLWVSTFWRNIFKKY